MKLKVEPYIQKKGNRVGSAAIAFDSNDGVLSGFLLVGFTICEDENNELFVLFPSSPIKPRNEDDEKRAYFFLRPDNNDDLDKLESAIIDLYHDMTSSAAKK